MPAEISARTDIYLSFIAVLVYGRYTRRGTAVPGRGSVTESVTRGKVMKKVPNLIAELELYPV
jgi:hypothetical protein